MSYGRSHMSYGRLLVWGKCNHQTVFAGFEYGSWGIGFGGPPIGYEGSLATNFAGYSYEIWPAVGNLFYLMPNFHCQLHILESCLIWFQRPEKASVWIQRFGDWQPGAFAMNASGCLGMLRMKSLYNQSCKVPNHTFPNESAALITPKVVLKSKIDSWDTRSQQKQLAFLRASRQPKNAKEQQQLSSLGTLHSVPTSNDLQFQTKKLEANKTWCKHDFCCTYMKDFVDQKQARMPKDV